MSERRSFDIVRAANQRSLDFIHQSDNLDLLPGTGAYSTPFRGGLFGETEAAAVAEELSTRGVDVLWLGTNPGVKQSLDYILNPPQGPGDFPNFQRQVESGLFASRKWSDDGKSRPDWSPLERPRGGWGLYRDVLSRVTQLENVAMANVIPWGSRSVKDLVKRLGAVNRPLLGRMLEFADGLNAEVVQALRPRLIIVPFSLGRERALDLIHPLGVSRVRARDVPRSVVNLVEGRFKLYVAYCQRGRVDVRTVFVRHASSLRLSSQSREQVTERLVTVLGEAR